MDSNVTTSWEGGPHTGDGIRERFGERMEREYKPFGADPTKFDQFVGAELVARKYGKKRGNILTTELLPPSIGTGGSLNRDRLPDTRPRKQAPADVVMCAPTHGGTTSDTAQGGFTMTFADTGCTASCTQHPGLLEPHPLFPWGARPPEIPTPPSVRPLRSPRRGRGGVRDNILEVGSTVTVEDALLRLNEGIHHEYGTAMYRYS